MRFLKNREVVDRVEKLEIPFNALGLDRYGISRDGVIGFFSFLGWFYRDYFNVTVHGIEHVPARGRAMLVGNHSGGVAIDGGMVLASLLLDMQQPRLAQGMAEKFLNEIPFASTWLSRVGQFTGLPEHAIRLLEDERLLVVFPEGARGTAKLYSERYSLIRFGTGFMRLALRTQTPIIPFAFIGAGEIFPTILNLYRLGKLLGAPYIPVPRHILPLPLPKPCQIHYGAPLVFKGNGRESDDVIQGYVDEVVARISDLIAQGREASGY